MLDLEITTRCNLRCRFCFVKTLRPKQQDLPLSVARSVLAEAFPKYGPDLHLSGGEPLCYPDLVELLRIAADSGYSSALINTNGTLLDDAWASDLVNAGIRVKLTISLDGQPEDHDQNRGKGLHASTMNSIRRALDHGLTTTIFTIVTRRSLPRTCEFLDSLFDAVPEIEGVFLIPVGDISKGRSEAETAPLGPAEIVDLGLISASYLIRGSRVRILDYPVVNLVYKALGLPVELVGSSCTACSGRICVQADGAITPCHPVGAMLGRYEEGCLDAVERTPLFQAIAEKRFEGCQGCPDAEICGHCRAAVHAATGRLLGNDWICRGVMNELVARLTVFRQKAWGAFERDHFIREKASCGDSKPS